MAAFTARGSRHPVNGERDAVRNLINQFGAPDFLPRPVRAYVYRIINRERNFCHRVTYYSTSKAVCDAMRDATGGRRPPRRYYKYVCRRSSERQFCLRHVYRSTESYCAGDGYQGTPKRSGTDFELRLIGYKLGISPEQSWNTRTFSALIIIP